MNFRGNIFDPQYRACNRKKYCPSAQKTEVMSSRRFNLNSFRYFFRRSCTVLEKIKMSFRVHFCCHLICIRSNFDFLTVTTTVVVYRLLGGSKSCGHFSYAVTGRIPSFEGNLGFESASRMFHVVNIWACPQKSRTKNLPGTPTIAAL